MKLCTTSSDSAADRHVARASWPLSEPALAYFPNARSGFSDRDLGAGALTGGIAMAQRSGDHGHVPVLLSRCVELLTPALTRQNPDGGGAVLVDATLGAGGHLNDLPVTPTIAGPRSNRGRMSRSANAPATE